MSSNNPDPAYSLLGFCARAGKCRSGAATCQATARAGTCHLLLISDRMAPGGVQKLQQSCRAHAVPWMVLPDASGEVGRAIGKPHVLSVAIMDKEFAKTLEKAFTIKLK